jgi:hypothetical protein
MELNTRVCRYHHYRHDAFVQCPYCKEEKAKEEAIKQCPNCSKFTMVFTKIYRYCSNKECKQYFIFIKLDSH